jgi:hypothetical protein
VYQFHFLSQQKPENPAALAGVAANGDAAFVTADHEPERFVDWNRQFH